MKGESDEVLGGVHFARFANAVAVRLAAPPVADRVRSLEHLLVRSFLTKIGSNGSSKVLTFGAEIWQNL